MTPPSLCTRLSERIGVGKAAVFCRLRRSRSRKNTACRDSYFPDQWAEIKACFSDLSKRIKPDLIFSHRPDDRHQDHRVISELTWCTFRDHLILEYEIPKYEGDLGNPNWYLPISKRYCGKKITTLLECFDSQLDKPWFDAELFRSLMRIRGSECNSRSRYAEAFYSRKATFGFLPSKN